MGIDPAVMRIRHDPDLLRRHLAERKVEGLASIQLTKRTGILLHVYRHRITQDRGKVMQEATGESPLPSFVAITPSSGPGSSGIEIHYADGIRIHLAKNFDGDTRQGLLLTVR